MANVYYLDFVRLGAQTYCKNVAFSSLMPELQGASYELTAANRPMTVASYKLWATNCKLQARHF